MVLLIAYMCPCSLEIIMGSSSFLLFWRGNSRKSQALAWAARSVPKISDQAATSSEFCSMQGPGTECGLSIGFDAFLLSFSTNKVLLFRVSLCLCPPGQNAGISKRTNYCTSMSDRMFFSSRVAKKNERAGFSASCVHNPRQTMTSSERAKVIVRQGASAFVSAFVSRLAFCLDTRSDACVPSTGGRARRLSQLFTVKDRPSEFSLLFSTFRTCTCDFRADFDHCEAAGK